ncbi:MAG: PadR family transcriptional regulator [Spirochaetia bacterium]|nr:PadR family transcriptional regulator [Spirochaetia bacterium]
MEEDQILHNFITELNRGTMTLCVLASLHTAQYGYSLLQNLAEKGIELEANTLYPMLRRLESQGVLQSSWDTSESRPRKFYTLSEKGKTIFTLLKEQWGIQQERITSLLREENYHA